MAGSDVSGHLTRRHVIGAAAGHNRHGKRTLAAFSRRCDLGSRLPFRTSTTQPLAKTILNWSAGRLWTSEHIVIVSAVQQPIVLHGSSLISSLT